MGIARIIGCSISVHHENTPVKNAGKTPGYTAPRRQPVSLWIGDSYTAGDAAKNQAGAESCLTADRLGWTCEVDAEAGTGFLNNGHKNSASFQPLGPRIAGEPTKYGTPDFVVIDSGRNDGSLTTAYKTAATADFDALAREWPHAQFIVIAPYVMPSTASYYSFADSRPWLKQQAGIRGWSFVDPIADGWINATSGALVASDHFHPSPAGHAYLAAHLAPAIRGALSA